jgi:Nuclease-related domain
MRADTSLVASELVERKPGQFAEERFRARKKAWLRRIWWVLPLGALRGRGNIDHVLVGPPGIFLLDSKDLFGAVSVTRGRLSVRWHEDPGDGYENRSMAPRIRRAAIELERALRDSGIGQHAVQPVVVLWARFEQRSVMSGEVAWVRGKDLAKVLEQRPAQLSPAEMDEVAAFLRCGATGPRPSRARPTRSPARAANR